jgi:hypothetical protein
MTLEKMAERSGVPIREFFLSNENIIVIKSGYRGSELTDEMPILRDECTG